MSSSTTRARWSLTGAATTRVPRGRTTPAGSLRRIWSSCWVGAELGQVRPRPASGQPRREASSTVEGMFRSPTSSRGAARDPVSPCSSRSWRTLWPWRLDRCPAATVTGRNPTWMVASSASLLATAGRREPQVLDPLQGQSRHQEVAVGGTARVGAGQRSEVVPDQRRRVGPEPVRAQGLGDRRWLVGAAAAGQVPVDLLHGQQVDPQGPNPGHDGVQSTWLVCSRRAPAMFQVPTRRLAIAASQRGCRPTSAAGRPWVSAEDRCARQGKDHPAGACRKMSSRCASDRSRMLEARSG
jgi:hypothetical protein